VSQLLRAYEQRFLASLATGSATSTADLAARAGLQGGAAKQHHHLKQSPQPSHQQKQQQQQQQQQGRGVDERAVCSADFNRPVFAAVAFALLGKAHKASRSKALLKAPLACHAHCCLC